MKVRKLKKQETRAVMPMRGNDFHRTIAVGATAVVIVAMMMLAATPGLAETVEGWGDAELIDAEDGNANIPQVAMDRDGNAIAVWFQFDGTRNNIWSNRYVVGVGWGDAQLIETDDANAEHPQVAMNGDGDAVAVWRQFDGYHNNIWSNRYIVGDGWGDALIIGLDPIMPAGDADWPQVAMDGDGNAVAVWQVWMGTQQSIWSNQYVVGDGWYYAWPIEYDHADARSPQVAMDGDGNAVAVWHQWDGKNIWSSRYVVGDDWGDWGDAELIETGDGDAYSPEVAVDEDGNAIAVWRQWDGTNSNIWSNRYDVVDGCWGDAQPIETDVEVAYSPQVAIDGEGNAIAVWEQSISIWSNRYVVGEGWGLAQPIETDDMSAAEFPQVAMDGKGNAIAVWRQLDDPSPSIWSNRYVVGVGWGLATLIETEDEEAVCPQVAMDANGNAVAVWQQYDGATWNIWSNRFNSLVDHYQYRHHTGNLEGATPTF
jgi:hypothetical protein